MHLSKLGGLYMSKELKIGLITATVEAILALIVGYILLLAQADSLENKTVEKLAGYFDAVDESMSYDQVMKYLYEDVQEKESVISQLSQKNEELEQKLNELNEQHLLDNENQSIIESAQTYADASEYLNALALLHSASNKTPYMEVLVKEYEGKYELQVVAEADSLIRSERYDEANDVLNDALKIIPESTTLAAYIDKIPGEPQYLMEICAPYQTSDNQYYREPTSFKMAGKTYTNGFSMQDYSFALFNLDGQYSSLNFILGHIDETTMIDGVFNIYLDGQLFRRIEIDCEDIPELYNIPIDGVIQMKIEKVDEATINYQAGEWYGFADITLQ